uniref:RNA-dependent RNA polymerase n=1 Tax=Quinoa-associated deltapartitivirus 1 TaxID=2824808 RepID=A0A8D9UH08_9VIRU|nr:TPA_asm: RNA-dependent RNA polymerase [Quinoa-associated deltapartitivirus 1]
MAVHTLHGYEYTSYEHDLELIGGFHLHQVRRESSVTYRDEFALRELIETYPVLYEQILEGWSRSYYTGEAHLNAILQYGQPNITLTQEDLPLWIRARQSVSELLGSLPHVRAFDVNTQLDIINYEPSSAAGYDYNGAKGPTGDFNHTRAIHRAKATLWSTIRDDDFRPDHTIQSAVPDVGYTRTQLTDIRDKLKVRGVWGRAFHYILLEGTTADPLLQAFKQGTTFLHIGSDPTISVPQILSDVAKSCKWLIALDWRAFDASVNRFEIHTAFNLIKERIEFPNRETEECFELCRHLFIHKKIAAPDSKIYWSHKGIPSGSYFTSIIGSVVNRMRIEFLWLKLKGRGPKMCFTQGDDSLIGEDEYVNPNDLAELAAPLGWALNAAKTEVSRMPEYVSFLGRTIYGGLNHRDITKCIRLLIFPEYPVESGSISAYRAKSIAEDSGGTSKILNDIARSLRRKYGLALESEVPKKFKIYVP